MITLAVNEGRPCKNDWDSTLTVGEWMKKRLIGSLAFLLCIAWISLPVYATEESPLEVSANAIRVGCLVSFAKQFHPVQDDPLSAAPFDLLATWQCDDGEKSVIDKYEINGASPEVATVLYWGQHHIVVLVKWSINSQAADYSGDFYKVFIYKSTKTSDKDDFERDVAAMKRLPAGWDGQAKDGKTIVYPFKDADSIRKRLQAINFDK